MFLELVESVTLLLSLALVYGFICRRWPCDIPVAQLLSGCLFGAITILGMEFPVTVQPGVIFDARSVVLSLASVFGGPVVGVVSGFLAAGFRAWIGGAGTIVGIAAIIVTVGIGLTYRYLFQTNRIPLNAVTLLLLGFVVHIVEVGLFLFLPENVVDQVVQSIAIPLILTFTPATAFLGLIFKGIQDEVETRQKLDRTQSEKAEALEKVIHVLSAALEARDPYTAGHEQNVAEIAVEIRKELGFDDHRLEGLHLAATVHDVGKIRVPGEILTKPSKLSPEEWAMMQQHPDTGADFLAGIRFDWPIAETIRQHHERLDGSGYPRGLADEQILDEAKIIAVADVVEAMANDRPYRKGLGVEAARAEILGGKGTKYDPAIVDLCIDLIDKKVFFASNPGDGTVQHTDAAGGPTINPASPDAHRNDNSEGWKLRLN